MTGSLIFKAWIFFSLIQQRSFQKLVKFEKKLELTTALQLRLASNLNVCFNRQFIYQGFCS